MDERPKNSPVMDTIVRTVGRHFVTLSCMQTAPGADKENPVVVSGFVVEVGGLWFYITAGHVLREFEQALASGSTFDTWRLGDYFADGRFKNTGIPFDFSIDQWLVIRDEDLGLDYGVVLLRDFFRMALEGGKVAPLREESWGDHATEYDHWLLVGVPAETVAHDGGSRLTARLVAVPLQEVEAPNGAETKAQNQFFARLADDSVKRVSNVEGMSGGPIFSFKKEADGLKYKAIGVQSAWYPRIRVVAACPLSSLCAALEDIVKEVREKAGAGAT